MTSSAGLAGPAYEDRPDRLLPAASAPFRRHTFRFSGPLSTPDRTPLRALVLSCLAPGRVLVTGPRTTATRPNRGPTAEKKKTSGSRDQRSPSTVPEGAPRSCSRVVPVSGWKTRATKTALAPASPAFSAFPSLHPSYLAPSGCAVPGPGVESTTR